MIQEQAEPAPFREQGIFHPGGSGHEGVAGRREPPELAAGQSLRRQVGDIEQNDAG